MISKSPPQLQRHVQQVHLEISLLPLLMPFKSSLNSPFRKQLTNVYVGIPVKTLSSHISENPCFGIIRLTRAASFSAANSPGLSPASTRTRRTCTEEENVMIRLRKIYLFNYGCPAALEVTSRAAVRVLDLVGATRNQSSKNIANTEERF